MERIFAKDLYAALTFAASRLTADADRVNALNVFPVPDGDTGSNMSMTISGVNAMTGDRLTDLSTAAKTCADLMLRSARGNSGVILSVYFRGLARALAGLESAGVAELTSALASATEAAYGSVMNPTEGTILSVMRAVSETAATLQTEEITDYFTALVSAAESALFRTREQLPVLKQAGVVDAGGCGFVIILVAMAESLSGKAAELGFVVPEPLAPVSSGVSAAADFDCDITFPYCTECIVEKSEEFAVEGAAEPLHAFVLAAGDSVVYVEDESIVKIHVHTCDPGAVLTEAVKFGSLLTVKVENMRKQHTELKGESAAPSLPEGVGFVAVANGDGLCEIFSDLGVNEIVSGGQTMNPSTEQLLEAIKKVGLKTVFVLPNNSNIVMAASSAARLAEEEGIDARVIASKSIPQGITALCSYDPDVDVEQNYAALRASLSTVKTLSLTNAVRDAEIDGMSIKQGQFIGLIENKVKRVADDLFGCLDQLVDELTGSACVTAYCGEDLSDELADAVRARLEERFRSNADVTVVRGGQPVYSLIISGE